MVGRPDPSPGAPPPRPRTAAPTRKLTMSPDDLFNVLTGIAYSVAFLACISIGLAVIFGMMGIINFAHGEFLMLGAFLTITLNKSGINIWLAMIVASLGVGLFGAIVERVLIQRLYGRLEATMLATFGLSQILVQVAVIIWGTSARGIDTPLGAVRVGSYRYSVYTFVVIGAAVLLIGGVYLVYTRSRFGLMARAATMDKEMASAIGINASRVNMGNFALGAALAGAGGALLSPLVAVTANMGATYVASAFVTVVLGGPGVVTGTATASGLLGTVQRLVSDSTTAFFGTAALLVVAIVLLRFMPTGISSRLKKEL